MTVRIQTEPFDIGREISQLTDNETGAIVTFTGQMRASSEGRPLASMTLEHYPGMTEREIETIETQACRRFALTASLVIHRVGPLHPGDGIVLVIAAARHRQAAFDGASFLMDYMKTGAPFWKQENFADGTSRWVDARDSDHQALDKWQP